jgi:hypothetical protein
MPDNADLPKHACDDGEAARCMRKLGARNVIDLLGIVLGA